MTIRDVREMSYPELEELLEGISKNSEKEREMLDGGRDSRGYSRRIC